MLPCCGPAMSNLGEVVWYQGNVSYKSCETPVKSKEATSLGKMQSKLTAQTDSRLSIVYSQKHAGAECRLSPQDGLGTFPCQLLNSLNCMCRFSETVANRQQGLCVSHLPSFRQFNTRGDQEILQFPEFQRQPSLRTSTSLKHKHLFLK